MLTPWNVVRLSVTISIIGKRKLSADSASLK